MRRIITLLLIILCLTACGTQYDNTTEPSDPATPTPGAAVMTEDELLEMLKPILFDARWIVNLFCNPQYPADINEINDDIKALALENNRLLLVEYSNDYWRYTDLDFDKTRYGLRYGDYEWMQQKLKSIYGPDMIEQHFSYSLENQCSYIYYDNSIWARDQAWGSHNYLRMEDIRFLIHEADTLLLECPQYDGFDHVDENLYPPVQFELVMDDGHWIITKWSDFDVSFAFSDEETQEFLATRP